MTTKEKLLTRRRSYMDRAVDVTNIRQRILIVCEGTKTEPQYFEKFRFPGLVVTVEGLGMNTLSLVNEAIRIRDNGNFDQVWCVFDKDDFPIDHFDNAIQCATENGMYVAYSNQAFELWYVLHFEFLHTSIDRSAYIRKLDRYLKHKYKKNDPQIYSKLRCYVDTAIQNAQKLMAEYPHQNPGGADPSTTVYKLVAILIDQAKPLSGK